MTPSTRTFYRTRITLEVLHETPIPDGMELGEVYRETIEGHYSGFTAWQLPEILSGPEMAKALADQGSDPEFFELDEFGNDLEDWTGDGEITISG